MKSSTIISVCCCAMALLSCSPVSLPESPPPGPAIDFHLVSVADSLTAPFPSITFTHVSGAGSYSVWRKGTADIRYDSVGTTPDTAYIDFDTLLLPDTTYVYKVRADNREKSETDTALIRTPVYMILSPKQNDGYRIGDTVRVRMKAAFYAKAGINLELGQLELTPPGVTSTFNMQTTPVVSFVIPPKFVVQIWNDSLQKAVLDSISPVCDSCFVRIFDYNTPSQIFASSYGYFRITN